MFTNDFSEDFISSKINVDVILLKISNLIYFRLFEKKYPQQLCF